MAAVNHKDTYKASAVFLIVMGMLYLIDKFIGFASHGLPWVMQKDNLLLYAAVIFLWFKADKSVGIVLTGIWLILNIGLVIALLGQMSAYLLPAALLLVGVIFIFSFDPMMKIVLIGAGNVATHLGIALQKAGCLILQVYSRTEESASALAARLSVDYTIVPDEIRRDADLYIVALKDAVLRQLAPVLVKGREQALFVHTAGSMSMDLWKGLVKRYGVLYPMQTFSKQREVDFNTVPFFIEASAPAEVELLRMVAVRLSPKVYEVTSGQRRYLHLAAVFACNFANHMYALSSHILEKQGIPFEVMLPLIDETAGKVHELSPTQAQTGPAVRYDENVISKHLEMLADEESLQELYEKISKSIHNLPLSVIQANKEGKNS